MSSHEEPHKGSVHDQRGARQRLHSLVWVSTLLCRGHGEHSLLQRGLDPACGVVKGIWDKEENRNKAPFLLHLNAFVLQHLLVVVT